MVAPELEDGRVAVLGGAGLIGLEPRPDPLEDGLTPDPVEILVGLGGVEQVARRERLELPGPEMIDDQAVEDGPEVVAEPPLVLSAPASLSVSSLVQNSWRTSSARCLSRTLRWMYRVDRVVVPADQLAHRRLAFRARRVGAADRRPARRDLGQLFF